MHVYRCRNRIASEELRNWRPGHAGQGGNIGVSYNNPNRNGQVGWYYTPGSTLDTSHRSYSDEINKYSDTRLSAKTVRILYDSWRAVAGDL